MIQDPTDASVDAGGFPIEPLNACEPFPLDSGVIDVRAFGVIPNDNVDDTAALQRAFSAQAPNVATYFLPCGVIDISATLEIRGTDTSTNWVFGAGPSQTTVRYTPRPDGGAAISTSRSARNLISDLSVQVVSGTPPISAGIRMASNGTGGLRNVVIAGPNAASSAGIRVSGTLLVSDVRVQGFDDGITVETQALATMERITLQGQSSAGIEMGTFSSMAARAIDSNNLVVGVRSGTVAGGPEPATLIADSVFQGTGPHALSNYKAMYLRNVSAAGYQNLLWSPLVFSQPFRGNHVGGLSTEEFWANGRGFVRRGGPAVGLPSPETMVRLPVKNAPAPFLEAVSRWGDPRRFGGLGNGVSDDAQALQAAAAASSTMFLPTTGQAWVLGGSLSLPATLQRVVGFGNTITSPSMATLVIEQGALPLSLESLVLNNIVIQHRSGRPLVLRNVRGSLQYQASTTLRAGPLYLEDVEFDRISLGNQQEVFGRHLVNAFDREGRGAKIVNSGGSLFVLGYYTSNAGTTLLTERQGVSEILGAFHEGNGRDDARFVVVDSALSVGLPRGGFNSLLERRGVVAVDAGFGFVEGMGGWNADALTSLTSELLWATRNEIILDSENLPPTDVVGSNWERLPEVLPDGGVVGSGPPGGYLGRNFFRTQAGPTHSITYRFNVPEAGMYELSARWLPETGATRGSAAYQIGSGSSKITAPQTNGGRWTRIGTQYPLPQGQVAIVVSPVSNEPMVADALRLKKVQ
jgi:hypothetical protein